MSTPRNQPEATLESNFLGFKGGWATVAKFGVTGVLAFLLVYVVTVQDQNRLDRFASELKAERDLENARFERQIEAERTREATTAAHRAEAFQLIRQAISQGERNSESQTRMMRVLEQTLDELKAVKEKRPEG